MSPIDDLLTVDEAAAALRLSRKTIRKLAAEGHLRPVRLKGIRRMYIERRDLEAYAASREPWA